MKKIKKILKRILCLFYHISNSYEFDSILVCERCGKTVSDTNFRVTTEIDFLTNKIMWYLN